MANKERRIRAYTVDELIQRRKRVRMTTGILIGLAIALALVSLYRDEKANIPGLVIAVLTFVTALSGFSQIKEINKDLASAEKNGDPGE